MSDPTPSPTPKERTMLPIDSDSQENDLLERYGTAAEHAAYWEETAQRYKRQREAYKEAGQEAGQELIRRHRRIAELESLISRLDWQNIHTHYGHTDCEDCEIVADLRFSKEES